ncbi:hypothetical protein A4F89_11615 [Polynucleobacter asymbioticus]|jgi:hypothetical protein|uniref:Transmembrane protein n=1 Tax=Polynucleobacter asymbioticus TaxID=576611 RepID=A0AAC9NIL8_9BURK|nr:hypothetical protein A4F89_11615 [Polynucleobacter asymbioticus]APC02231.1 hypothetical protein AOC25_11700 [Polynucleobacter asymbioticus]
MSGGNLEEMNKLRRELELKGVQVLAFSGITIATWYVSPSNWFLLPLTALIVRCVQTIIFIRKFKKFLNS